MKFTSVKEAVRGPSKCATCTALNCKIRETLGEQWNCAYYTPDVVQAGLWPTDGHGHVNITRRKGGEGDE